MAWLRDVVLGLAATLGSVWVLIEISYHMDIKEDAPDFCALRKALGQRLHSLIYVGFTQWVRGVNKLFLQWFDALFHGKGTLLEQGLWIGLIFSPVMLILLRLMILVAGKPLPNPSGMLLMAMTMAFVLSIAVICGKFISDLRHGVLFGVLGVALFLVLSAIYGGVFEVALGGLKGEMTSSLEMIGGLSAGVIISVLGAFSGLRRGLLLAVFCALLGFVFFGVFDDVLYYDVFGYEVPDRGGVLYVAGFCLLFGGAAFGMISSMLFGGLRGGVLFVGILVVLGVVLGSVVRPFNLWQGFTQGSSTGVGAVLGWVAYRFFFLRFRFTVHPLRSLGLSLVAILIIGIIMRDAGASFHDLFVQRGPIVLSYVAFNIFADNMSLLETRWILQRSASRGLLGLLGFLLLALVLSAAIILTLPLVLGELPNVWNDILFRGSRPWMGILLWSTFAMSGLFYLFVVSMFLFVLPGHWFIRLLRSVGRLIDIESRPFTAVTRSIVLVLASVVFVIWGGTSLYHLAVR